MKNKLIKNILLISLISIIFLSGCWHKDMANEINEKVKSPQGYKYSQLIKDYGEPTIILSNFNTIKTVIYIKDCKDEEEALEKFNKGKKLKAVYVSYVGDIVSGATYEYYLPEKV